MKTTLFKSIGIVLLFISFIALSFFGSFYFASQTKGGIEVNKRVNADFIVSDKKNILLFFGYFGCKDVCTPILQELATLYESQEFATIKKDVAILFINLTPATQPQQVDLFAKFFNNNFQGIYLSQKELLNIDRTFGVYFSQSLNDKTEFNHTDYIYLLENTTDTKILKKIYSAHPLQIKQLINDITLQNK